LAEWKAPFTPSTTLNALSPTNKGTELYNISQSQMVFATRLMTTNKTIDENVDDYFGTIYV
jgi:hypothetical protein